MAISVGQKLGPYEIASPDGRWIAYLSNESGASDIYVQAFPSGAQKKKVSSSTGIGAATQQPRWNPNGRELFYLTGTAGKFTLMSVAVTPGSTLDIGTPKPLFEVRANGYAPSNGTYFYSVSNDGQRFLVNVVDSDEEPALNIIVNWQESLKGGAK